MDKTKWPVGEWTNEPDTQLIITSVGLQASIIRNPIGALCGYVGVEQDHPAYGKSYEELDIDVHGGLTYANRGREVYGEEPSLWYFGFDCAHSGDVCPSSLQYFEAFSFETYKNIDYVNQQIESLAKQLNELKGNKNVLSLGE